MKQKMLFDTNQGFTNRSVKSVTFLGKLTLPIHRWYRLTPSFSPDLANDIADEFGLGQRDLVLDPFSGVGTVPLCMKYRGIPSCSVEINPYLHFVGTVKTRNYGDLDAIEESFGAFVATLQRAVARADVLADPKAYVHRNQSLIPRISNPQRWWSPGNLAQLVCIRKVLSNYEAPPDHLDLIRMAVLGILIPVSNAKHNHVSLTFAPKPLPTVDVVNLVREKTDEVLQDLRAVGNLPSADANVYSGNSKFLSDVLPTRCKFSAVLTSPPYPNRFSYARETRPHLFFFDFIKSARGVGQLESDAIGGTWGKATSVLASGVMARNDFIRDLLAPHMRGVPQNGGLMASYVIKYFNDMYKHIGELVKVCRQTCRVAYVVGNSKFYGNPLPTDRILAEVFEHFGFRLNRIDRMRKRQSKRGLYEAVIFLRRVR